jgi:hypothetical protein
MSRITASCPVNTATLEPSTFHRRMVRSAEHVKIVFECGCSIAHVIDFSAGAVEWPVQHPTKPPQFSRTLAHVACAQQSIEANKG